MSFDIKLSDGDISIYNGDLQIVENTDKLIQDILKILSTEIGSNKKFPAYGCGISQSMIGKAYDQVFVSNVASEQIRTSLQLLIRLQAEQIKSFQKVTPQEQIAAVKHAYVSQNEIDPRHFNIVVSVINKAFGQVNVPGLTFTP